MRNKFILILGIVFVAGLLLCGLGSGIFLATITSFEVIEDVNEELIESVIEIPLPADNSTLYFNKDDLRYFHGLNAVLNYDELVPSGQINIVVKQSNPSMNFQYEIEESFYIANESIDFISEHPVKFLNIWKQNTADTDGFQEVKEFFKNLKDKKIYYNNEVFTTEVHLNPQDAERFKEVKKPYKLISYDAYMQNKEMNNYDYLLEENERLSEENSRLNDILAEYKRLDLESDY